MDLGVQANKELMCAIAQTKNEHFSDNFLSNHMHKLGYSIVCNYYSGHEFIHAYSNVLFEIVTKTY